MPTDVYFAEVIEDPIYYMETTEASNTFGGNLLVAQSGGPTAVINSSVAGVIQEAGRHEDIEEIYGGLNGIYGILNEELIDINEEKAKSIEALKHTPAAALGHCRYKINFKTDPDQAAKDMDRLFEVFEAHNIRFFFYAVETILKTPRIKFTKRRSNGDMRWGSLACPRPLTTIFHIPITVRGMDRS